MFKRIVTLLLGIGLIGLGALFFWAPEQAYLVQLLKRCWPLFLVLAGLVRFAGYLLDRQPRSPVSSLILTTLGGVLLAISLRDENSLLAIVGRYWFWVLLAYMLGRLLRQYLHRQEDGRAVSALSPASLFVMLLIAGTGLSANYFSKHREFLTGLHTQLTDLGDVSNYVFGNPIKIEDEPPLSFKLSPNARLALDQITGDVEIRTGPGSQATAKLIKFIRATNEEKAKQAAQDIHLQLNSTGAGNNQVQLGVAASNLNESFTVTLLIELPSQSPINVALTEVTGAITVTGLRGDLAVRNANRVEVARNHGRVTVELARGLLQLEEIEGEVNLSNLHNGAELKTIQGKVTLNGRGGSYALDNITGALRIGLNDARLDLRGVQAPPNFPGQEQLVTLEDIRDTRLKLEDITGNVLIHAARSRIETDAITGDLQITTSSEPVRLNHQTGNLRVTVENGSVMVRDLKGDAQLEASQDITVQNFAGPLSVKTKTGKINLAQNTELAGDLTIVNEYGQTRVTLPKDIPFRLDAITHSGRLRTHGFDDIELQRNQRAVTANHRVDGQAPLISLRSTSGNIELNSSGLALASNEEP